MYTEPTYLETRILLSSFFFFLQIKFIPSHQHTYRFSISLLNNILCINQKSYNGIFVFIKILLHVKKCYRFLF